MAILKLKYNLTPFASLEAAKTGVAEKMANAQVGEFWAGEYEGGAVLAFKGANGVVVFSDAAAISAELTQALTNYYTKAEIDAILANYYTKSETDAAVKVAKDAANVFAREEFKIVKEKLEDVLETKITTKALKNSIEVYNANRAACRAFCDVAAEYCAVIKPSDRHAVLKARWFMEKSKHTALVNELIEAVKANPAPAYTGKKVVVSGIMVEPYDVLDIFAENGLAIVADDLAQESRNFRQDVPADEDPIMALAKAWNEFDGCSLATDADKPKGQMLIDAVKKYDADAVIVAMMKFCDPEEFDYPILIQEFEAAGVRNLQIEIDQESTAFEQVKTRLQTFAEIL